MREAFYILFAVIVTNILMASYFFMQSDAECRSFSHGRMYGVVCRGL